MLPLADASGARAFRRSTAALARGFRPAGSTPGHASWDVARAGVTRLRLSQSRDCISRTGRSTGVNDTRSRPGAGCKSARGDRPRSTFESTLAKGPSVNEMEGSVTISVTDVKSLSPKKRQNPNRAVADLSWSAKADHPVGVIRSVITGSSAFADDDVNGGVAAARSFPGYALLHPGYAPRSHRCRIRLWPERMS